MAFVRAKVVEGYTYYQLVHNYREAGKHRQKVLCHLGKHSSLDKAVEDKRREEEELRDKAVGLFDITTEHKETRYCQMLWIGLRSRGVLPLLAPFDQLPVYEPGSGPHQWDQPVAV